MALDRQTGSAAAAASAGLAPVVKRFDRPERMLVFDSGRLEVITVDGQAIGKGSYAPGWRWSRCTVRGSPALGLHPEALGVVLSGHARVACGDGMELDLQPGDCFLAALTTEHDEWVVGPRPCEILYLRGVETLIRQLGGPT
jgi:mannose-6-phosphate isomerase-like protein (cupin superfamily)